MKKLWLIFIMFVFVNAGVFSQESLEQETQETDRRFSILTSPAFFLVNLISLGAADGHGGVFIIDLEGQYKIDEAFTFSLTLSFFSAWQEVSHIGVKPMFIYRPFRTGLKGFYVGFYPSIGWQIEERIRWDYDGASNINSIETQIGIGINIGNKWIFNNGFTLQLGTGIGRSLIISQGSSLGGDFRFFSDGRLSLRNLDIHILDLKFGVSF